MKVTSEHAKLVADALGSWIDAARKRAEVANDGADHREATAEMIFAASLRAQYAHIAANGDNQDDAG